MENSAMLTRKEMAQSVHKDLDMIMRKKTKINF